VQQRFGKDTFYWDVGTSPVLTEKDVVVAMMHHGESYLAAFDKRTGDLHWKVARNYKTPEEGDHAYTTPILVRHPVRKAFQPDRSAGAVQSGQTAAALQPAASADAQNSASAEALLVWGGQHLTAHAAADGKLLWYCGDFNPDTKANWVAVASPVIAGQIAVVPYGRGTCLHGIRLAGSGDVTATHRVWKREDTGSFVPTPAEYKGRVYLLRDRGQVECIEPQTGKTLWTGELPKRSSNYYASPTVADGKLYAAREDGVVFVVRIDGPFEVLAENDLGERVIASPVPLSGRLLLRGEKHLFCVGDR
jgi:outer membrane protein assembly factor BamB